MKHFLFPILLLSIVSCTNKGPQKQQALASRPASDTSNSIKPGAETTTSIYTDDELMIEFAIVNDADGYSYVRDYPSTSGTVIDTLHNGTIVFCMEPAGNWSGIDYAYDPKTKMFRHGFISKSRLEFVSVHSPIKGLVKVDNEIVLGDDQINITVTQEDFKAAKHKLQYNTDHNFLETIDGKEAWGRDGNIPRRQYKGIRININGNSLEIPQEGLESLYEPNLNYTTAHYDKENDVLYIQSMNSDGAGAYLVLWRIEKGIYKDRFMFNGF